MSETETPEIPELTAQESIAKIATDIDVLMASMDQHISGVVKEISVGRHGHEAGNVTTQDLGFTLKAAGVKPMLAKELSRHAIIEHERFRWSVEGKEIQAEARKPKA